MVNRLQISVTGPRKPCTGLKHFAAVSVDEWVVTGPRKPCTGLKRNADPSLGSQFGVTGPRKPCTGLKLEHFEHVVPLRGCHRTQKTLHGIETRRHTRNPSPGRSVTGPRK